MHGRMDADVQKGSYGFSDCKAKTRLVSVTEIRNNSFHRMPVILPL